MIHEDSPRRLRDIGRDGFRIASVVAIVHAIGSPDESPVRRRSDIGDEVFVVGQIGSGAIVEIELWFHGMLYGSSGTNVLDIYL